MPLVSVVMVCHRDTPYLRPAIRSVLAQTWRDLELVFVDNGSGLSSAALAPLADDPRFRWVRLATNEGIPRGHNAGVAEARGEFIALLDYDDLALPQRIERQVGMLQAQPELGLVGGGAATIDGAGNRVGVQFCLGGGEPQRVFSAYGVGGITPSYTGRAAVFRAFPYRPAFLCSGDYDFFARVAERHAIGMVPEVLLHYRRHAEQTTARNRRMQVFEENCVRLLAGRRRAGESERFDELAGEMTRARQAPPEPRASHRDFSRRFLAEGFAAQAVYHARRLIAEGRDATAVAEALGVFARVVARSPGDLVFLTRLFLTGPVRTHGLRDLGPRLAAARG